MPDRLAEIRARRAAIQHDGTTTPWTHDDPGERVASPGDRTVAIVPMYDERDFVAHAPDDISWLLDRERRMMAVIGWLLDIAIKDADVGRDSLDKCLRDDGFTLAEVEERIG